jgi:Flp pilus assembly pilin Flp
MKILKNNSGQGLTEYITLLVLVSLVAVGAAKSLGKSVREKIKTARSHINSDINFNDVRD